MRPHNKRCIHTSIGILAARVLPLCSLALLLSACGGGGSGTGGDQPEDPVQQDIAIAYIQRILPTEEDEETGDLFVAEQDFLDPIAFQPGARLVVRARATPGAKELVVTERIFGDNALYDVKDLEVSYDGSKLLFAARAPEIEDAPEEEQPTWDIWEYNLYTDELRRVIESDVAEAQGQDVNPHYLPDGRIVFSSTRQILAKANMLDEGKPQYNPQGESRDRDMLALHVMNSDGSNITQITFNSSHEIEPVVNANGEIVYMRWDNIGSHDEVDLYKVRPDGTEHQHLYGRNSHNSGTDGAEVEYRRLQAAPDGRLLALIGPRQQHSFGGDLIFLDPENFSENDQPVPNSTSSATTAQTAATHFPIRTEDEEISLGGYLSAAYPLWDGTNRLLISWGECLVEIDNKTLPCTEELINDEDAEVLAPAYGVWMYQPLDHTMRPLILPQNGIAYTDVVVMQERTPPPILTAKTSDGTTFDSSLVDDNVGILNIRSVYDLDGMFDGGSSSATSLAEMRLLPPAQRPARFLRLEKAVLMPDDDTRRVRGVDLGAAGSQLMRDILGYTPIEPDGSVKVKVTANVPFTISILDENGQSISPRHQYWLQIAPGEIITCNGCHEANSTTPHGRIDARPSAINTGAASAGPYSGLNPEYAAQAGETMAETRVQVDRDKEPSIDSSLPSADIEFSDIWSLTPAASFNWRYSDLDDDDDPDNDNLEAPINASCEPVWTALCRITIHYPINIAPLWDHPRNTIRDSNGDPIEDENSEVIDQCTDCHSRTSARFGDPEFGETADETPTQLDLTNEPSEDEDDHFTSFRYLFLTQTAQEHDENGALVDKPRRDENGEVICQTNEDGQPIVDEDGVCTAPVLETVRATMTGGGARASRNFFLPFVDGGTHEGWLSPAELKMISEWLDIGAQYYNDPFVIPQG